MFKFEEAEEDHAAEEEGNLQQSKHMHGEGEGEGEETAWP